MGEDSHSPTKDRVKALLLDPGIAIDSRFSRRYDWAAIRAFYEQGYSMRECQLTYGFSGAAWSDAGGGRAKGARAA